MSTFIERSKTESLAEHLLRNAIVLGADRDQLNRLRLAFRLSQGTNTQRAEGGQIAVAVRAELQSSMEDVLANAHARGEKVVKFNDSGARRVKTRDGLATLAESGGLTDIQVRAGLAYRLCYELVRDSLGSCLGRAGEGRGVRDWSQLSIAEDERGELKLMLSAAELHRAYVITRLNQLERAVFGLPDADGRVWLAEPKGDELGALRRIAGEGHTLNAIAGRGAQSRETTKAALVCALDVIARVLRITAH